MNKNRLEAFSDGMFAIIVTIMVLDIKPVAEPLPDKGALEFLYGRLIEK